METLISERSSLFLDYRNASFAMRELEKDPRVVKGSITRENEGPYFRVWWKEVMPYPYRPPTQHA